MEVEIVTGGTELETIRDAWNALVESHPAMDFPFYRWEWFHCAWRHLEPETELFVVLVKQKERLVGVLPLIRTTQQRCGVRLSVLRFVSPGITPRNTFLRGRPGSEGDLREMYECAFRALHAVRRLWHIVELANVPRDDPFHGFLAPAAADMRNSPGVPGFALIETKGRESPFIRMDQPYAEYSRAHGDRGARRRCSQNRERFSASNQSWGLAAFQSETDSQIGLDLAFAVRATSWKGPFTQASYPAFYREITSLLCRDGCARVYTLMLDSTPIAAQYFLCKNGTFHLLTNDYDLRHRESGPGSCLLHLVIERAFQEGWKVYDFTGESYEYKRSWATGTRQHSTFQLFHSGLKSALIYQGKTRALPMIRRVLRRSEPSDAMGKASAIFGPEDRAAG